jgi:hypothetical protein
VVRIFESCGGRVVDWKGTQRKSSLARDEKRVLRFANVEKVH